MPGGNSRGGIPAAPSTKTEFALQMLRESIASGEFRPGQRLRVMELARTLQMSPTPIREALRLLQADRLVEFKPHQGIVVAAMSAGELEEIYRLRQVLEAHATGYVAERLTPRELARLEELHGRFLRATASGRGLSEHNAQWHWALYELADSQHLNDFVRRLWDSFPWRSQRALPGRTVASRAEHEAVMVALRAGDGAAAAAAMAAHLESGKQSLLQHFERESG